VRLPPPSPPAPPKPRFRVGKPLPDPIPLKIQFPFSGSDPPENPVSFQLKIDTDYFGKQRNKNNPVPGPFEITKSGTQTIKVWPKP
jgi:hypothetical protein